MRSATLEKLVWVLVYGGLIVVCLGIFAKREDAVFGWSLIAAGALAATLGAVFIYVRSLRKPP